MRMSKLFGHTLRQAPSEARTASHQLLLRAGMIRPSAESIYTYLPLGQRVLHKIEQISRREMEAIEGQELLMPLALTAEEVAADLCRKEIESYRQLPTLIHQIRPKSRDEHRSGGGLLEAQEFIAKEAFSFHADLEGLNEFYPRLYQAYVNIFQACRLETVAVETEEDGHEFIVPWKAGKQKFLLCSQCDYAASAEGAEFAKPEAPQETERATEKVATPDCKTMAALASFLEVPLEKTLKVVFYATEGGKVIIAAIRGDLDISETKLKKALGIADLYLATEREILAVGAVPGYGSPIGVHGAILVVDDSVPLGSNLVAGANEDGYHLLNVNYPRDFQADILTDIAQAQAGYACPRCRSQLTEISGIEIGYLKRGKRVEATYLDRGGKAKPIVVGSYGLDLARLMAAVVEQHHDQKGIIWPAAIAPYQIHLVVLGAGEEVVAKAEEVYAELAALGYEALYDDRDGSAGVKFNDADLIGIPVRLTLSRRTLKENAIEIKLRWQEGRETIGLDALPGELERLLATSQDTGGQGLRMHAADS